MKDQRDSGRKGPGVRVLLAMLGLAVMTLVGHRQLSAADGAYHLVEAWPTVPASVPMGSVSWVDFDAHGAMYMFRRCPIKCTDAPHPGPDDPAASMLLFDSNGNYQREWEPKTGGQAKEAHGLHIDRHGNLWTTDVMLHVVKKYGPDGTLLLTLGKNGVSGVEADTFNKPTNVFVASDDSVFVTDGYGNQRVVKFAKDGKFLKAWGKKGTGPGEFRIPHSVTEDRNGRIIIADRCGLGETKCTDGRIQIFDRDGRFLAKWTSPAGNLAPQAVAVDASNRLYIDDTQNTKVWILDAKTLRVLDTVDGVSGHGMTISRSGDDIYVTGGSTGVKRYSRAKMPTR